MNCKNCGAPIQFKDSMGRCPACGSQYELDPTFSSVEIFICYTEIDANGRRTKDSVLANEIYQKLESKKIQTFYERSSASTLIGDQLELARQSALHAAKVILLIGTSTQNFEALLKNEPSVLEKATILPIYADMDAYALPSSLSKYQALNFSAIGSDADLIKNILRLLGREEELSFAEINQRARRIRMTILIVASAVVLIAGIALACVFLLKPNGDDQPSNDAKQAQNYANAQALQEEGKYLEAAALYQSLGDYLDSVALYKGIYDQFDGYYQDQKQEFSFYINIQDASTVNVQFTKNENGALMHRVDQTVLFSGNSLNFSFVDHNKTNGTIKITLQNDKIIVESSILAESITFMLTDRTDRPMDHQVTSELINRWLTQPTSLSELTKQGYEMEHIRYANIGGEPHTYIREYGLKNSKIRFLMISHDNVTDKDFDDYYIYAIVAPAELLLPQHLKGDCRCFIENNILYVPNVDSVLVTSDCTSTYPTFNNYHIASCDKTISAQTMFGAIAKSQVGERLFYQSVLAYLYYDKTNWFSEQNFDGYDNGPQVWFMAENETFCLYRLNLDYYYKANKQTGEITPVQLPEREDATDWYHYPDIFADFLKVVTKSEDATLYYIPDESSYYYEYVIFDKVELMAERITIDKGSNPMTDWKNEPNRFGRFLASQSESEEHDTLGSKTMYVTANGALNMRSEPNTEGEVLAAIPTGEAVTVISVDGEWAHVQFDDKTGYCSLQYLSQK